MEINKKSPLIFIGAGKIAASLIPAVIKNGYLVEAVISGDLHSAKKLALKNNIEYWSDDLSEYSKFKGVIFLTVHDSAIEILAKHLSKEKLLFSECLFVHTSGALSSSALDALKKKKSLTGSLHILQSFPSLKPVKISGCYSAVESSSRKGNQYLTELSLNLGLHPFRLNQNDKTKYHLAAVYASNFINAVIYGSSKLFSEIKNVPSEHFTVFEPIIKSVLHNIKMEGAAKALSGPVERGDIKTIKKHLTLLNKCDYEFLETYTANSLMLVEAAEEKYNTSKKKHSSELHEIARLLIAELYG